MIRWDLNFLFEFQLPSQNSSPGGRPSQLIQPLIISVYRLGLTFKYAGSASHEDVIRSFFWFDRLEDYKSFLWYFNKHIKGIIDLIIELKLMKGTWKLIQTGRRKIMMQLRQGWRK